MEDFRRDLCSLRNMVIDQRVIDDKKLCAIEEMDGGAFFESLDRFPHGFFPSFIDTVQNSLRQGNENFDGLIDVLNEFKQSGLVLNVRLLNQMIRECESRKYERVRAYLLNLKCEYVGNIINSSLLPYLKLLRSFRIRQLIAFRRQSLLDERVIHEDSLKSLEDIDYDGRSVDEVFEEASKLMDVTQHELEKPDTDYEALEHLLKILRDNSDCLGGPELPGVVDKMFEIIDSQDQSKDRAREYFNRVKTKYAAFKQQMQPYVEMLREEARMTDICSEEPYHVKFVDRLQPYVQWLRDDSVARHYMLLSWRSVYYLL